MASPGSPHVIQLPCTRGYSHDWKVFTLLHQYSTHNTHTCAYEFGGLTGDCILCWYWEIVVDYKVWQIRWWWIIENSLYMRPYTYLISLHFAIIIRWSLYYCTNTVHTIHTYITHVCRHILNILLCWLAITGTRGFPSIIERFLNIRYIRQSL